jgi:hypothetical protein
MVLHIDTNYHPRLFDRPCNAFQWLSSMIYRTTNYNGLAEIVSLIINMPFDEKDIERRLTDNIDHREQLKKLYELAILIGHRDFATYLTSQT